jgi:hypothetical protein
MRQIMIIFLLLLLSVAAALAQEKTSRQETAGRGHFGAPVLKYTVINDQGVLSVVAVVAGMSPLF